MAGNTNLFGQVYIDFVQSIFFTNNDRKYAPKKMHEDDIPDFLKNQEMLNTAISILLSQKRITHIREDGRDYYQADPGAMKSLEIETILQKRILVLTERNLRLQNWDLRTKLIWGTIGAAFGAIVSNGKDILELLK